MYSTIKRLSAVCIILAAFHAFMGLALLIFSTGYNLPFGTGVALFVYIITSIISFIIIGCSLRILCNTLDSDYEYTEKEHLKLKKRVEELEFKANM